MNGALSDHKQLGLGTSCSNWSHDLATNPTCGMPADNVEISATKANDGVFEFKRDGTRKVGVVAAS
ncbi:hypothetical protein LPE01_22910 [Lactiplantibacillus pentosus]|nr:hypothetical protein LPE01_22910 [Lactiplantibacillus pentosus]